MDQIYFNLSGVYDGMDNVVDLTDIGGTNCYCDDLAKEEIIRRIGSLPQIPEVRFIDSGNYHYMSLFFMRKITEPFTLLLLDNHPDTKRPVFGDITSCGGWVREATETIPLLKKVVMAGVDPSLIEEEQPLPDIVTPVSLQEVVASLDDPVYISLDKDIMNYDYARTDWSQGSYTLDEIMTVITGVFDHSRVVGFDICGEKKEDPTDEDLLINKLTNKQLLKIIPAAF